MSETLKKAVELVNGDRQRDYAHPLVNFSRIATHATAITGVAVRLRDIALLNIAQKLSRERHSHKDDNQVDTAGYANTIEMLYTRPDLVTLFDDAIGKLAEVLQTIEKEVSKGVAKCDQPKPQTISEAIAGAFVRHIVPHACNSCAHQEVINGRASCQKFGPNAPLQLGKDCPGYLVVAKRT